MSPIGVDIYKACKTGSNIYAKLKWNNNNNIINMNKLNGRIIYCFAIIFFLIRWFSIVQILKTRGKKTPLFMRLRTKTSPCELGIFPFIIKKAITKFWFLHLNNILLKTVDGYHETLVAILTLSCRWYDLSVTIWASNVKFSRHFNKMCNETNVAFLMEGILVE